MSGRADRGASECRERFRLKFQQGLREFLARNGSAAEGFGLVWEQTSEHVPLKEEEQAGLYWELIQWARSYDLFTCVEQKIPIAPDSDPNQPAPD
jgi:hypothetical protein